MIDNRRSDQSGKIVIITGANSGIGFEAARQMAGLGAHVVLACRNLEKGEGALIKIRKRDKEASVELMELDLSNLASIGNFVKEFRTSYNQLDILVNNAGIMATAKSKTTDGFEFQFGTNHLGHFALTGGLLDLLLTKSGSRVVTVTSIAHFNGSIDFNDIGLEINYSRMGAYRRSKLANILFAYELDRRFKGAGAETISVAVHPGVTSTRILWLPVGIEQLKQLVLTSPVKGARATVLGATAPGLSGGEYIGPSGFRQMYGRPDILRSSEQSNDPLLASRLWEISEELTGISYRFDL